MTGMVISVPPYETFSLIKNNILDQSKNYTNDFKNSNLWGMWPLGHGGHVPYSFINMLFISAGIFDYKLRPHILSVGTTANAGLMIELGLDISQRNPTYTATTQSKEEIIDNHMSVLCSFGLSLTVWDTKIITNNIISQELPSLFIKL